MLPHRISYLFVPVVAAVSIGFGLYSDKANAVDAVPPGLGFCFGFGFGFGTFGGIVDADNTGGLELLVASSEDLVKLDADIDGFAEATITRQLRLISSTGADVWPSAASLVIGTDDVVSAFSDDVNPIAFVQLTNSRLLPFYPIPFVCEGYGVAESGGQRYVVATLGVSAADGDEASGTDYSVIKVYVLNAATGAIIKTHKFSPQGGNYLLLTESGVGDFDGDGDDELFVVRTVNLGAIGTRERFKIVVELFNLVTGVSERRFVVYRNDRFTNNNIPPP